MTEKRVINFTEENDGGKAEFEIINGVVKTVWIGDYLESVGSKTEFDEQVSKLQSKIEAYKKAKEFFIEVMKEVKK